LFTERYEKYRHIGQWRSRQGANKELG
jgi:hypothetical protein